MNNTLYATELFGLISLADFDINYDTMPPLLMYDKLMSHWVVDNMINDLQPSGLWQIINHGLTNYSEIVAARKNGYMVLHNDVLSDVTDCTTVTTTRKVDVVDEVLRPGMHIRTLITRGLCDTDMCIFTHIEKLDMRYNKYITTCDPFAKTLKILMVEHSGIRDYGLRLCANIVHLDADVSNIIMRGPFVKYLRVLSVSGLCCQVHCDELGLCENIEELRADGNRKIKVCDVFAKSLVILSATGSCGISDYGLRLCMNIKNLDASNNARITTCEPFAKSLRILSASGPCGISDHGLHSCINIENLNATGNTKITTCRPFAKSLIILFAAYACGISDHGLRHCSHIVTLCADNNCNITTCKPFAKSLITLSATGSCGIPHNEQYRYTKKYSRTTTDIRAPSSYYQMFTDSPFI